MDPMAPRTLKDSKRFLKDFSRISQAFLKDSKGFYRLHSLSSKAIGSKAIGFTL